MKKFFGMLLGAMIIFALPAHADDGFIITKFTDFEKTATPEDSVLVYGIVAIPFSTRVLDILFTSPDMSKPDAPVTHILYKHVGWDNRLNVSYYFFTAIVPKDTEYQFVELKSIRDSGMVIIRYFIKRGDFSHSTTADFKSQKEAGIQYLGVLPISTNDIDLEEYIKDADVEKAEKRTEKWIANMYSKHKTWGAIFKQAMAEKSKNRSKK